LTAGSRSAGSGSEAGAADAAAVVERLRVTGARVAVAESCTGGGLGRELTAVPGASSVFWGGVIAYDDAAKIGVLSVPPDLILSRGAVSEEVGRAMARGVLQLSGVTWSVGITGVAGPEGGTREKPVGTVCIAVEGPTSQAATFHFTGDREQVRRQAVRQALALLETALEAS
jgi:nicotinamide-nucleotide amidase